MLMIRCKKLIHKLKICKFIFLHSSLLVENCASMLLFVEFNRKQLVAIDHCLLNTS